MTASVFVRRRSRLAPALLALLLCLSPALRANYRHACTSCSGTDGLCPTCDPIGNRVAASEAGVPWTYATNSLNQYTSATEDNTPLSFAYDLDGNMTYRPVDATSGWTQLWNAENRMVETFKGTDRLTFTYDYMGRRVEKCVYSGDTLSSKTRYVYDGFKCVEELDGLNSNAVLMRHVWQPFDAGLDVILATTAGDAASYFLHDANMFCPRVKRNFGNSSYDKTIKWSYPKNTFEHGGFLL